MRQEIKSGHNVDANGNPAGGRTVGVGISIEWQDGPLGNPPDMQKHNGAFVEGLVAACIDRMEFYQKASGGKFACRENSLVITKLEEALHWLDHRTAGRVARKVEGTHVA